MDIKNLSENFHEGKSVLRGLLSSNGRRIKHIENSLVSLYNNAQYDDNTKAFIVEVIKAFYLRPLLKQKALYMRQYAQYRTNVDPSHINVEKAKQVPIQDIFQPEKAKQTSKRISCCCPFHVEKTPSFVIYKETNTFCCFGCGAKGDVIEFVKKYFNKSFVDSVKYLGDFYGAG